MRHFYVQWYSNGNLDRGKFSSLVQHYFHYYFLIIKTINCVAEVIRGNQVNQAYFNRVNAPIEPPKPIIIILLMTMINEKQPFELRCAALYCFQCFLYKNDLGQAQIIETLLPAYSDGI